MTLAEIYREHRPGSAGFILAVERHQAQLELTRNEIRRIARAAESPDEFQRVVQQEAFWRDPAGGRPSA